VEEALSVLFCCDSECGVSCGQLSISYRLTLAESMEVSLEL